MAPASVSHGSVGRCVRGTVTALRVAPLVHRTLVSENGTSGEGQIIHGGATICDASAVDFVLRLESDEPFVLRDVWTTACHEVPTKVCNGYRDDSSGARSTDIAVSSKKRLWSETYIANKPSSDFGFGVQIAQQYCAVPSAQLPRSVEATTTLAVGTDKPTTAAALSPAACSLVIGARVNIPDDMSRRTCTDGPTSGPGAGPSSGGPLSSSGGGGGGADETRVVRIAIGITVS